MSTDLKDVGLPEIFCEFFEVIIHNILFVRKLYPEGIFIKRKKYGVIVYKAVHPYLKEYISQSLKSVIFHLKTKQLKRVFVCFIKDETVIERFVFDILNLIPDLNSDPYAILLEQQLRSICLKLITSARYLKPLPEDCTFNLQLHISEYSLVEFNSNPENEEFPWIQICSNSSDLACANIIPLKNAVIKTSVLQMYIESLLSNN